MQADTIKNKGRAAEILLVEDNYGDVILTQLAFQDAEIANNITVADSGEQAMQMLRQEGLYDQAALPDLILLDLNLPKKTGKEVLDEIKTDKLLKHIPVIILTSSRAEMDVVKTYNLHANSYLVKPVTLDKFSEIVDIIERYWFSHVVLTQKRKAVNN